MKYLLNVLLITVIATLVVISGPPIHYKMLRSYVADNVVRVTNEDGSSGGTGFHVIAPSGKTYILTNSHVCGVSEDGVTVTIVKRDRKYIKKIVKDSEFTDLCLIEPLGGMTGLSVSYRASLGEVLAVVGHPSLFDITMSRGELISEQMVKVFSHYLPIDKDGKMLTNDCEQPKHTIEEGLWGTACIVNVQAYLSNIQILPGNSGSPLINFYGGVVGVAFAGTGANWGLFVTIEDINEFLLPY